MVKSRNSDISYRTVTVTLILQIRHVFSQFLLIPIGGYVCQLGGRSGHIRRFPSVGTEKKHGGLAKITVIRV